MMLSAINLSNSVRHMLDTRSSRCPESYYFQFGAARRPDCIWTRACWYAKRFPNLQPCDELSRSAVYLLAGDTRRSEFYFPELTARIRRAVSLRQNRMQRLATEARILAYQDLAAVASVSGLALETVQTYANLFFDVVGRMDARGWIKNTVVLDSRYANDFLRSELYRQAYFGGPEVAEHWLQHLTNLDRGAEHDLTTQIGRERERLELEILAAQLPSPLPARIATAFMTESNLQRTPIPNLNSSMSQFAVSAISKRLNDADLDLVFAKLIGREKSRTRYRQSKEFPIPKSERKKRSAA